MVAKTDIDALGRRLGEKANAERVVLFGSYAKGTASDSSDVDFLVIARSELPRHKRSRQLYRSIRSHKFPVDVLVYTPEEIAQAIRSRVSFVSQALREGETVYER